MPSIIDTVNGPWAIIPDRLIEIQGIYATHLRGEKINIPDLEVRLGRKLDNKHQSFMIHDGVAVIPVDGAIAKKMNLFSQISGGASTQLIQRDIEQALKDPGIRGIILQIDSPGGTVDGTAELADFIFQSRGAKPIVAFSDGMICSAAYWIASAADSIHITGQTNNIGSIGVVAAHRDYSKAEQNLGIKTTEITAGKYKRIASQYEPLSEEGRADIQDKIDALYSVFVDGVARNRGASVETVLSDMADGRVFIGQQAIDNGLVDGVATLDDLIDMLAAGITPQKKKVAGRAAAQTQKEYIMDKEQFAAEYPELHESILADGREQATMEAADAAAAAENTRIMDLAVACLGEDTAAKFNQVVSAGLSPEQVTALGISIAPAGASASGDAESRKAILDALKDGGDQPVGKVNTVDSEQEKDFDTLVKEHQAAHNCSLTAAMKAVAAAHPEAHAASIKKTD